MIASHLFQLERSACSTLPGAVSVVVEIGTIRLFAVCLTEHHGKPLAEKRAYWRDAAADDGYIRLDDAVGWAPGIAEIIAWVEEEMPEGHNS